MKQKIYSVIKVEVKNGGDALNVLLTTTDKEKAQRKFKQEVAADKKTNPFFKGNKDFDPMEDDDVYCVSVWDEGRNNYLVDYTLILIKETELV